MAFLEPRFAAAAARIGGAQGRHAAAATCALLFVSCLAPVDAWWLSSWWTSVSADSSAVKAQQASHKVPFMGTPSFSVPLHKQYVPVLKNGTTVAYKTAYFGEINVGSPHQTFTAVFDTGSGHLILPSGSCITETCAKHRQFNSAASSTSQEIEHNGNIIPPTALSRDQVSITFGTGKVVGEFVKDRVCLGTELCVDLRIVTAKDMTPEPFALFKFDGVLGLGLAALTLNRKFSFFGQLTEQHPTMQPRYAVYLARSDQDGTTAISFGGYDAERASTEVRWARVAKPELGYWQVSVKSVRIGSTVLEDCADGTCRAVLDTGTSLLGVPKMSARTLHGTLARKVPDEVIEAANGGAVDCRTIKGYDLHFDLGEGLVVTLSAEDYSRPQPLLMTIPGKEEKVPFCRSLLLPVDMAPPLGPKVFIWGEPLLRKYYTVYDWGDTSVGFALAKRLKMEPVAGAAGDSTSSLDAPPVGSLAAGAPLA